MNKTSVLRAPAWAHQGEFIASGTVWNFAACVEDTPDTTSAEGMTYLHNVRKLKQVAAADALDATAIMYLGYKWPMEDDYLGLNGLSAEYITDGEGIIGLKLVPGLRIQEYVGTDYTNASGTKIGAMAPAITWSGVSHGALLYLTDVGQFTTASTNPMVRAQFIEAKGSWVIIEFVETYATGKVGA